MPKSPSGESEFSWTEEEWAQWFKKNRAKVELVDGGMQALRTGLQKLGLTVGDALIQFRADFEERMKLYPKLHAQAVPLAQRGWFLSGTIGISDLLALAEVCETATETELDAHVAACYRSDIANQMGDILREYPQRAFALQPAMDAHQREEYALSVPVFFAQADGIVFDGCARDLFMKKGKALRDLAEEELKAIAKHDPTTLELLQMLMWLPLSKPLPVSYGQTDRKEHGYDGLNRNTVLHGISLSEYATEENSLKAFSMLSYVASLMTQRKGSLP